MRAFLAVPRAFCVVAIETAIITDQRDERVGNEINAHQVRLKSRSPTGRCPSCRQPSRRLHSRTTRTLADTPILGHSVEMHVEARRFFCDNDACSHRTFTERLTDLAGPRARCTDRLRHHWEQVGLALGGRPGARFATDLGQSVSFKTLLRAVRAAPAPVLPTPRCLGVDDWAIRKGQTYGTILYDLEEHRPVDLLPNRTAQGLSEWLRSHPGVEVISRDRAQAYADGARLGAPGAIQVADRFHLVKNLGDALERLLNHHRTDLKAAQAAVGPEVVAAAAPSEDAAIGTAQPAAACASSKLSRQARDKEQRRAWRYGRYEQIKAYYGQGMNITQIARAMHMERKTVRHFLHADTFPERNPGSGHPRGGFRSVIDDHKDTIQREWESGCHNAAAIFRMLQSDGYTGGYTRVKDHLRAFRHGSDDSAFQVTSLPSAPEQEVLTRLSPRTVASMVLRKPEERTERTQTLLDEVERRCEPFRLCREISQRFLTLLRGPKVKENAFAFADWLEAAGRCEVAEVRRFAKGLEQDRAAVEAAMALPWSNGPVEGAVNRLKTIKRQMYGRANFDLLRRRVLEPT